MNDNKSYMFADSQIDSPEEQGCVIPVMWFSFILLFIYFISFISATQTKQHYIKTECRSHPTIVKYVPTESVRFM